VTGFYGSNDPTNSVTDMHTVRRGAHMNFSLGQYSLINYEFMMKKSMGKKIQLTL